MGCVLIFGGLFLNDCSSGKLRLENMRLLEPDAFKKHKIAQSTPSSPANGAAADAASDEESVVNVPTTKTSGHARSSTFCAACRSRDSKRWWKAPKGLSSDILCDDCGMNWRKYADLNARPTTREETALNAAAQTTSTFFSVDSAERTSTKRAASPAPLGPVQIIKRIKVRPVVTCLAIHA